MTFNSSNEASNYLRLHKSYGNKELFFLARLANNSVDILLLVTNDNDDCFKYADDKLLLSIACEGYVSFAWSSSSSALATHRHCGFQSRDFSLDSFAIAFPTFIDIYCKSKLTSHDFVTETSWCHSKRVFLGTKFSVSATQSFQFSDGRHIIVEDGVSRDVFVIDCKTSCIRRVDPLLLIGSHYDTNGNDNR